MCPEGAIFVPSLPKTGTNCNIPASSPIVEYSSINRLYAQNPVFEIVYQESVKVYLHIHVQRDVQQNFLCAASCVTKNIPISPRFLPTIFYRRANSVPDRGQFLIYSRPN